MAGDAPGGVAGGAQSGYSVAGNAQSGYDVAGYARSGYSVAGDVPGGDGRGGTEEEPEEEPEMGD